MPIYYHATPSYKLRLIGVFGLDPAIGVAKLSGRGRKGAIYLTKQYSNAIDYIHDLIEQYGGKIPKKWAILQVKLPVGMKVRLDPEEDVPYDTPARYRTLRYIVGRIPPENVKLVHEFEVGKESPYSRKNLSLLRKPSISNPSRATVMYHITPKRNLDKIMKQGLKTRANIDPWTGIYAPGLYLATSASEAYEARRYDERTGEFGYKEPMVILRVRLPGVYRSDLAPDPESHGEDTGWYIYYRDIPPENIAVSRFVEANRSIIGGP